MFLPHYKFCKDQNIWVSRIEKQIFMKSWLGEIDYSSGSLKHRSENIDEKIPFKLEQTKPLLDYIDEAKTHLVDTVISYRANFGNSHEDYSRLAPEEH